MKRLRVKRPRVVLRVDRMGVDHLHPRVKPLRENRQRVNRLRLRVARLRVEPVARLRVERLRVDEEVRRQAARLRSAGRAAATRPGPRRPAT